MIRGLAAAALTALLAAACAQDPRVRVLENTGDTILSGYHDLATRSAQLGKIADAFCDAPSRDGLERTRRAWSAAMLAWMRIQPVRFGPVREGNRDFRLQFWPDPRDMVAAETDALLQSEQPIDVNRLAKASVAVQGFPAAAYLLFGEPGDEVYTALAERPRRCALLQAVTARIAATADELVTAWSPDGGGYADMLTRFGDEEGRFANPRAALSALVNSLIESVQRINTSKLGWPLGVRTDGDPQPLRVESRRARHSLANMRANLVGIERLFTAGGAYGLKEYLAASTGKRELATRIQRKLNEAQAQADAIDAPLVAKLRDSDETTASLRELLHRTRELEALLTDELAPALNVEVGFNFNDGD